jgi:hypothetical protein
MLLDAGYRFQTDGIDIVDLIDIADVIDVANGDL